MVIYVAYLIYKCATGQTSWSEIKEKVKARKSNAKGKVDEERSQGVKEVEVEEPMISGVVAGTT